MRSLILELVNFMLLLQYCYNAVKHPMSVAFYTGKTDYLPITYI